ncbi:hypothetical protein PG997_012891 [Apiospora hydei]|uniref:Uncharacterized protein n=1 Tax=Apiospora hydei TaxID=1337664 RepID=A0ABR1V4M3_9PEZI
MSSDMDGHPPSGRTLVVGIDFGTTYSGVAYGVTENPDRTIPCQTWSSSKTDGTVTGGVKVPTTIRYLQQRGEFEWGFQIPEDNVHPDDIMRWFKLGLQPPKNRPDEIRNLLARHDSDRLVKDYLSGLGENILHFLRTSSRLGENDVEMFIRESAIQVVLTVPAVWEEVAKRKTLQAFENARGLGGLGSVTLVSEPEAAATYALHNMIQESSLEVGQSFIVLDAGGGTVDVITYTITALHPVLQVREAAAGAGDFCGAAFVDKAFTDHLQATLGNEEGFDNELLGRALPVHGLANNQEIGIRSGRLTLRAFDVHAMFEPYILKTIRLVKDQIKHYGVELSVAYDREQHLGLENKRHWDGMDGCWRVDAMHWFIRRGDRVAESKPYYHHLSQASKVSHGRPGTIDLTIYSDSKSDEAPVARNGNVEVLSHLRANFRSIPTDQLPVVRGKDGLDYYVLSCDIEVTYRSASTEYTLIHDNHRYDTVTEEYV